MINDATFSPELFFFFQNGVRKFQAWRENFSVGGQKFGIKILAGEAAGKEGFLTEDFLAEYPLSSPKMDYFE